MPDESHLDNLYFVDSGVYNCPFCNRRHVSYSVTTQWSFDWTDTKKCYGYIAVCHSCDNRSMHLSFTNMPVHEYAYEGWRLGHRRYEEHLRFTVSPGQKLDESFFYSVPTSFFTLDNRIPSILRELITEAEGCLKSNHLTGASACVRKVVYELARIGQAEGRNYEERIKSLKQKYPSVEPTHFDTLLSIQEMTSAKVHEDAYDGWTSQHLRVLLAALHEVLSEVYVVPALRADRRTRIQKMRDEYCQRRKGRIRSLDLSTHQLLRYLWCGIAMGWTDRIRADESTGGPADAACQMLPPGRSETHVEPWVLPDADVVHRLTDSGRCVG